MRPDRQSSRLSRLRDPMLVMRYAITGLSVAGLYAVLHLVFTRVLSWPAGLASFIAISLAFILQYTLHSVFTFRSAWRSPAQLTRFLITVLSGYAVSALVMAYGIDWLQVSDIYGVAFVVVVLPLVNFVLFNLWVFVAKEGTTE